MTPNRKILHVDMDAFFASVEQRDDPTLRGQPVAVGGSGGRGVVALAIPAARRYGVRSAMPGAEARRRCPELIFVRPDMQRYREVSDQVFSIFREATDRVEGLSLDEAYLDVTHNHWGQPSATLVAQRIKERIRDELRLTASAGVAASKSVAKIASAYRKPDGLTVVPPHRVLEFLHPLPVGKISGVGPVTASKLEQLGLRTIGALARADPALMRECFGKRGDQLLALARGVDPRPVGGGRVRKSQSVETTFSEDILDRASLEEVLEEQALKVCQRLSKAGRRGKTVTLKVRYQDFTTLTRAQTLLRPTADPAEVARVARLLLDKTEAGTIPVRLLGVGLGGLVEPWRQRRSEGAQLLLPFWEWDPEAQDWRPPLGPASWEEEA